ncbi:MULTISPECIES: RNA polymerase sigma factor [Maritimibacter]|jgi:RNA polymerase sigma-70 factor (ECF subfamily)|uniref:RNA polymerase sigma factor n=1 Tax=Maritimibacter TaxID=404235 RepID=UPI000324656F|nr:MULTISPECIES: RNA polymerase sigma factor [Maritimibacter]TYP83949.1 RNA polymerase sigma-70 factor (ECF subfamily) [Maritimibacter alkaliphilus HTCC2654]
MANDVRPVDPREAVVEHLPAMRAFAASLTRNSAAADDLVQDTIVKAWKNFDKFKPGTNLRAWLFTILRNTFYSDLRKKKREVEDVDGAMASTLSEKPHHDGRLAMADFEKVFAELPVEQREALILVGASGMSYEEAAETCGVAIGTIKSRINRGRARLAELLELNDDDGLELTDSATMAVLNSGMQVRKTGH